MFKYLALAFTSDGSLEQRDWYTDC